jgi:hypothetical protein
MVFSVIELFNTVSFLILSTFQYNETSYTLLFNGILCGVLGQISTACQVANCVEWTGNKGCLPKKQMHSKESSLL